LLGVLLIPSGLLIYGWTTQYTIHWIVPIGSTVLVGFGFVAVSLATSSYLLDAYGIYAASALAANRVMRNFAAAAIPLAGPPLWNKIGMGLGGTVLGFVGFLFIPVPIVLMRYGERMRKMK